jgi:UDP-N-acetylmuramyl pentapeptide synthase
VARPVISISGQTFVLAARGLHQADNAIRVWSVAQELGLDLGEAAHALENFAMPGGRGELIQEGALTILNDCYNANPQSFRAVIATAAAIRGDRRLVFVAGTMRELSHRRYTRRSPLSWWTCIRNCWRPLGTLCRHWSRMPGHSAIDW